MYIGNSFEFGEKEIEIWRLEKAVCKEMELAAIAEICFDFDIPLIGIKGITDFVQHPAGKEQFIDNLVRTSKNVADTVVKTIDYAMGKKLSQLE